MTKHSSLISVMLNKRQLRLLYLSEASRTSPPKYKHSSHYHQMLNVSCLYLKRNNTSNRTRTIAVINLSTRTLESDQPLHQNYLLQNISTLIVKSPSVPQSIEYPLKESFSVHLMRLNRFKLTPRLINV